VNGTGTSARFTQPHGIASDKNGNVYVADRLNNVIRKVTPGGAVTTFAGSGAAGAVDATGIAASFFEPYAVACDTAGNVYVADTKNFKIRMITPAGVVTTVAGEGVFGTTNGPANVARFGYPAGIAVKPDGSEIFVADYNTHVIRKISGGVVSTMAGMIYVAGSSNGTGNAATFNHPSGLCLDTNGDLLIADDWNNLIRKMTPAGTVSTVAGTGFAGSADGNALSASFNGPSSITRGLNNSFFITDALNHTIRKYDPATQQISTVTGTPGISGTADGTPNVARFNNPYGIAFNFVDYSIYLSDKFNHTIRKIVTLSSISLTLTPTVSTVCNGDSLRFTITPAGLSNYSIYENGIQLAFSQSNIIVIAPLSPGSHTFTCSAIDGGGALANGGPANVIVDMPFVPAISSTNTGFCPGDSLLLTASAGVNWLWSTGATTQTIYTSSGGTYQVTVTNASGCTGTSLPSTYTQFNSPPVSVTPVPVQVCPGSTSVLTCTAGNTYLWSTGATTQSITVPAGNYSVTVTQLNGCSRNAGTTVTAFSVTPPVITPSGILQLFPGDSILLTATGGNTYLWNNGNTGASLYVSNIGTYSVTSTDINGCTATSLPVQVDPFNTSTMMSVVGANPFCEDDSTYLQSAFASGNQWYFNNQPITGAVNPVYYPQVSGFYKVQVNIGNNFVFSDSVQITIWPVPASPVLTDTTICAGNIAVLNAMNTANATIRWFDQFTGGSLLYTGNPFTTDIINQPTDFYADALSPEGCPSGERVLVTVDVIPSPVASFTTTNQYQQGIWNVQFNNTTTGADSYFWALGDTATSTAFEPTHTYLQTADYIITLIASSNNGCTDTLVQSLTLFNGSNLFVPTTFTPNGDGKNDVFRVRGERVQVDEMKIFNQWGTLVWQSDATMAQWDGTASGQTVTNGTYFYRIRITEFNGKNTELTGTVTVIK
jgi:gliding motility-associated-like protein